MDASSFRYQVFIIKDGFNKNQEHSQGTSHSVASVGLVLGPHKILVGTGLPQDCELIKQGLQKHSVAPHEVEYVICPHACIDHLGNLNLFPNATFIVGYEIRKGDKRMLHDFEKESIPFEIDEDVEVIPTPGHVNEATSVVVKNTQMGTVAITGGVFETEADLEDPDIWMECSQDADTQLQSRIEILRIADVIIPFHGQMFNVPKFYKSEMKVIMTP